MKSAFWKLEWHVQFWQTHKSDKFTLKYNQSCIVIAKSSLRFFVTGKVQAVFKATLIKKKALTQVLTFTKQQNCSTKIHKQRKHQHQTYDISYAV